MSNIPSRPSKMDRLREKAQARKALGDKKVCSLKELGQYSSAATCDVPKQCQTCSWFKPLNEIKIRRTSIERWKKDGF